MATLAANTAHTPAELLRLLKGPYFDIRYSKGIELSTADIAKICEVLETNDTALTLFLESCGFTGYGVDPLSDVLSTNTTLTSLSLVGNTLLNSGATCIAKLLETNTALKELNLSSNHIGNLGGVPIAQSLEANSTLVKLVMKQNELGDESAIAFAAALHKNSSLLWLDLNVNHIGRKGGSALLEGLKENTTITYIGSGEILERTRENKLHQMRAFKDALDHAETSKWRRTKIMLVGEGKSGKTSLQRSLLGLEFELEWDSTVGVILTETLSTSTHGWSNSIVHSTADFTTEVLANATADTLLRRESRLVAKGTRGHSARKMLARNVFHTPSKGAGPTRRPKKQSEFDPEDSFADEREFKKIFAFSQQSVTLAKNDPSLLRITLWDFGGQKVFHAMHHLFITEYGLYLVVLDVTKIATPDMPKHLKFWLNSIKLHAPEAPVVLVGTHVDRLFNPYDVPLLSKKVEKMIGNTGLNFVCPEESIFFPVSNAINQGIDELRYAIDAAARRQDHVNALVRIQWIICLDEVIHAGGSRGYVLRSDESFQELAEYYGITDDREIDEMLAYFHQMGVILYFSYTEHLRDVITTDARWVLFEIGKVVRDGRIQPFRSPQIDVKGLEPDVEKLLAHGMLSLDLATHLWDEERAPFLLDLMRNLLLLSSWEFNPLDELYLVPSITNSLEESAEVDRAVKQLSFSCTVTFDFNETLLLDGLIERLICLLVEFAGHSGGLDEPILGRGRCLLQLEKSHVLVRTEGEAIAIDIEVEENAQRIMNITLAMMKKIRNDLTKNRLHWVLYLTTDMDHMEYEDARQDRTRPWFEVSGEHLVKGLPYNLDEFMVEW